MGAPGMSAVATVGPRPRPGPLEADRPPEARGLARDGVRLLVSTPGGDQDRTFLDLPDLLREGDLLVVNSSATLPASLPARGPPGEFLVNLSTRFGRELWLAEPRWGPARPGPLPLPDGTRLDVAGIPTTVMARYPGIARMAFVRFAGDIEPALRRYGRPIRYGHVAREVPLAAYQTLFARVSGSAEMPSAGRPFTARVLTRLARRGVRLARVLLHTGVSSLEEGDDVTGAPPLLPEPYEVPRATIDAIERTRDRGGRVIAIGTTVVRALESSAEDGRLRASRGFTRRYLSPEHPSRTVDGLVTGFHARGSTHLALLASVAGERLVRRSYRIAVDRGYLWHEFGDIQLILPGRAAEGRSNLAGSSP